MLHHNVIETLFNGSAEDSERLVTMIIKFDLLIAAWSVLYKTLNVAYHLGSID